MKLIYYLFVAILFSGIFGQGAVEVPVRKPVPGSISELYGKLQYSDKFIKVYENGIEILRLTYVLAQPRFIKFSNIEYYMVQSGKPRSRSDSSWFQWIRDVYWAPNSLNNQYQRNIDQSTYLYQDFFIIKVKGKIYRIGFFVDDITFLVDKFDSLNIPRLTPGFFFR